MDQVSRPVQVLFVLTLAFGALWLIALRPKAEEPAPPPPPASSPPARSAIPGGPGAALDKARAGAKKANEDNAARSDRVSPAAAGSPPAASAGTAPPSPAASPAGAGAPGAILVTGVGRPVPAGASPAAVNRALARGKAVVVLFYGRGSDDRLVAGEVSRVGRRGGRVVVFSASIANVSRFGALTAGVRVLQAPTVVVAGPAGRGRALLGYTDSTEVDQAINSVLPRR